MHASRIGTRMTLAPAPSAPPAPPAATAMPPTMPQARPTGVTVLAVLAAIGAVFAFFGAIAAFGLGAIMGAAADSGVLAALGIGLAIFLLVLAAVDAAAAYGLWTRKRWGWYMAMVGAALGILQGLASLVSLEIVSAILGLGVSGFIAWYLLSPPIQRWFGVAHKTPWTYKGAAS